MTARPLDDLVSRRDQIFDVVSKTNVGYTVDQPRLGPVKYRWPAAQGSPCVREGKASVWTVRLPTGTTNTELVEKLMVIDTGEIAFIRAAARDDHTALVDFEALGHELTCFLRFVCRAHTQLRTKGQVAIRRFEASARVDAPSDEMSVVALFDGRGYVQPVNRMAIARLRKETFQVTTIVDDGAVLLADAERLGVVVSGIMADIASEFEAEADRLAPGEAPFLVLRERGIIQLAKDRFPVANRE